jgi:hypothetical protein
MQAWELRVFARQNWLLQTMVLAALFWLARPLSAQNGSPEGQSGQWRIAGQNLSNS